MTLLTRLLELRYITSSVNRNCFKEEKLESLAREILKSKGIINPIIVKQESTLKFSVVEGDFEYYSAVKASEMDSSFEEIQVLILPKDKSLEEKEYKSLEEGISNQVNILRKNSIIETIKELFKEQEKKLEKMIGETTLSVFSQIFKKNINSLSKTELMTIPGIGKSTAEKIIDRREKEGKFKNIDEVFACCKNASKEYKEVWRILFVFD